MGLYAAFSIISAASWTYDYRHPPVKAATATQRMFIIRNTLYISALASIASLLAIQTGFAAAASLFPEKIGEAANPTRILIDEIGGAIVQANGIGLGLALAASYFPAAGHLHDAYEREKLLREKAIEAKAGRTGRHVLAARFRCVRHGAPVHGDYRASADRANHQADQRRVAPRRSTPKVVVAALQDPDRAGLNRIDEVGAPDRCGATTLRAPSVSAAPACQFRKTACDKPPRAASGFELAFRGSVSTQ